MRPSGQLVTSDAIKFQWRLPEPVLPADPMLTAPILPMLVRLSLPIMMAMLAMPLVHNSRDRLRGYGWDAAPGGPRWQTMRRCSP